jgi:hypothetical protein
MIPARPLYQGVRGSVWDPETSLERVSDWGGPDGLGPLVCCRKACHKAKRRVGERFPVSGIVIRLYTAPYPAHKVSFIAGGIVLAAICWAPSAQGRFHPEEALYLPTFSHLLIVNKLLSLSGSLSGSLSLSLSLSPPAPPRSNAPSKWFHLASARHPSILGPFYGGFCILS